MLTQRQYNYLQNEIEAMKQENNNNITAKEKRAIVKRAIKYGRCFHLNKDDSIIFAAIEYGHKFVVIALDRDTVTNHWQIKGHYFCQTKRKAKTTCALQYQRHKLVQYKQLP